MAFQIDQLKVVYNCVVKGNWYMGLKRFSRNLKSVPWMYIQPNLLWDPLRSDINWLVNGALLCVYVVSVQAQLSLEYLTHSQLMWKNLLKGPPQSWPVPFLVCHNPSRRQRKVVMENWHRISWSSWYGGRAFSEGTGKLLNFNGKTGG